MLRWFSLKILRGKLASGRARFIPLRMLDVWPLWQLWSPNHREFVESGSLLTIVSRTKWTGNTWSWRWWRGCRPVRWKYVYVITWFLLQFGVISTSTFFKDTKLACASRASAICSLWKIYTKLQEKSSYHLLIMYKKTSPKLQTDEILKACARFLYFALMLMRTRSQPIKSA